MKKILLFMALVGSLFGGDLNIHSYRSDSNSLSVIVENMENCYTNAECDFQVFIDTDNNSDTGFYGADYRIAGYDGEIHALKHASDDIEAWEWETEDDLLNFNQTIIDDNDIYIEFSDKGISVLNQQNNKFEAIIASYNNHEWVKEEDTKRGVLDHAGEYYAFENDDNIQYNTAVINDAISIFEHQQEINNIEDYDPNVKYRYAVYLSSKDDEYNKYGGYEFQKRGATLGRVFTTGNEFDNFRNHSDAGKVIKRYKEILEENGESTDDKDIITLYELELDDEHNEQFLDKTAVVNAIENEENLNFDNDVKPLVNNSSRVNKIMIAWQEASDDKYFQQAQDEIYAQTTYKPAQEKLESYGVDMSKLTTLSYLTIINIYVLEGATGSSDEKGGDDFIDDIFGRDDFDSEQFNNDLDYQLGIVTEFFNYYTSVDGQSITQHRKDTIKELLKMAKNNYHIATDLTLDQVFDIYQETDPDKNY